MEAFASLLGLRADEMKRLMQEVRQTMEGAVRGDRSVAKAMLETFAEEVKRSSAELGRIVGRQDAETNHAEMTEFLIKLKEQIDAWRRF